MRGEPPFVEVKLFEAMQDDVGLKPLVSEL